MAFSDKKIVGVCEDGILLRRFFFLDEVYTPKEIDDKIDELKESLISYKDICKGIEDQIKAYKEANHRYLSHYYKN